MTAIAFAANQLDAALPSESAKLWLLLLGAAFALIQALCLVILAMLRADLASAKDVFADGLRDLRKDMREGGHRFREHEEAIAKLETRMRVVERVCAMNHRSSDPPEVDPTLLRTNGGQRRGD